MKIFSLRKIGYIIMLLLLIINTVACNNRSDKDLHNSGGKIEEGTITNKNNSKEIEEDLKNEILKHTKSNYNKNSVLKIKEYENGYLVLMMSEGEGGGIGLFLLDKVSNNQYVYKGVAGGEAALSMGFRVNRVILGNDTVFFCNLNDSTWIPENDTRKETKYAKMLFEFDNEEKITENVKNDKGYILIVKSKVNIKNIELFNENNEIVSSYKDIGKTDETKFIHAE